jgi:hypothetical protein
MDGEDTDADYIEGEDTDGEHTDSDEDLDGIGCTEDTDEDEEMDGDDDNANVGSNSGGRSTNSMVNMVIGSMVVGVGRYIDGLPFCLLNI